MKNWMLVSILVLCVLLSAVGIILIVNNDKIVDMTSPNSSENNSTIDSSGVNDLEIEVLETTVLNDMYKIDEQYLNAENYNVVDSYTDDEYNYYFINLGLIQNVPVWTDDTIYRHTGGEISHVTYSREIITEESIEKTIEKTVSKTTDKYKLNNVSFKVTGDINKYLKADVGYNRQFGKVVSTYNGERSALSITKKFAETTSRSVSYSFGDKGIGDYRLSILTTCEIYILLKTDYSKSKIEDVIYSLNIPENQKIYMVFEYDSTGSGFENIEIDNQIEISTDTVAYKNLSIPERFLKTKTKDVSGNKILEISDSGYYGLYNSADTLNISEFAPYFSSDYLFCFSGTIKIEEINDGYQQVFLYNKKIDTDKEVQITEARNEYGMICGTEIEHSNNVADPTNKIFNFNWYVFGSSLKEEMFIRYDAHGTDEDSWKRISLVFEITALSYNQEQHIYESVFKKHNADTQNTVKASGEDTYERGWGLSSKNSYEKLDFSKYKDKATADYLFIVHFRINIAEINDGYQEILLYNELTTKSTDDCWFSGYVLEHKKGKKETEIGNYSFNIVTKGNFINNNMYIRFDAFGEGDDEWKWTDLLVNVTVIKLPSIINQQSGSVSEVF